MEHFMKDIHDFLAQITGLSSPEIELQLKAKLNQQIEAPEGHLEWARAADELGNSVLAFREAQNNVVRALQLLLRFGRLRFKVQI